MLFTDMYTRHTRSAPRTSDEIQAEIDEISATRRRAWEERSEAIQNANPYLGIPVDPAYTKLMKACEACLKELEAEKRAALAREQRAV